MNIYLISGISGAGKTVFIKALEDIGFFCTDNLPIPLLGDFIGILKERKTYENIAVGIDIREKDFLSKIDSVIKNIKRLHKKPALKIVFLDARNDILLRRYSETRRKHPLDSHDIENSMEEERRHLKSLRDKADYVIDTSGFTLYELRKKAEEIIEGKTKKIRVTIKLISFGYKYGLPYDADIIFDMRFLPNPYYVPELKNKSGLEPETAKYIKGKKESVVFAKKAGELLNFMIDNFEKEGKNFISIAFGCTGGKHRSVYMADVFHKMLGKTYNEIFVEHRDFRR